ncbi:class I SAM-dependent methyltransferase [Longitalea arenae]|uniref:class I SAM-dependent methyltransferase n=1 Tax=Longitalea arenae TaxID=2812558 RepID=UPI00196755CB|nr:class I SAM-dependent methyltransferase [Longitalea arenae]
MLFYAQRGWLRFSYRSRKGDRFTCNNCGKQYDAFAPRYPSAADKNALEQFEVVAGYGENVYCPWCMCTSRERLMIAIFSTKIPVAGKRILHLSPEPFLFRFLHKQASVISTDLVPGFYKQIDPHIQYADATQLPFPTHSFDMVIGNHIMEHIPDDRRAMQEVYRVLKPGGIAVLQAPFSERIPITREEPTINDPQKQSAWFGQKDHVRIYSLTDYLERLKAAGFQVNYWSYDSLKEYYRYAIQPGEGFIHLLKV